jgi:hypothetical protein
MLLLLASLNLQVKNYSAVVAAVLPGLRQSLAGAEVFAASSVQRVGGVRQVATGVEVFSSATAQRIRGLSQAATATGTHAVVAPAAVGGGPGSYAYRRRARDVVARLAFQARLARTATAHSVLGGLGQAAVGHVDAVVVVALPARSSDRADWRLEHRTAWRDEWRLAGRGLADRVRRTG